jgi:hypothetical protein
MSEKKAHTPASRDDAPDELDHPFGANSGVWRALESIQQPPRIENEALVEAIFLHIQTMRAAGRDLVNMSEVADALGISLADVENAIPTLKERGIKTE